jgi:molybdopterin synthase catalytic subunit
MTQEINIQEHDFDYAEEYQALRGERPDNGAIVCFSGLVRDLNLGTNVQKLYLEHYPGMTESVIEQLLTEAKQRWDIRRARVIHRVGELTLGEQIVFVGIASPHRSDAFSACQFMMDLLKTQVPLWKKEISDTGQQWLKQKESDLQQQTIWSAEAKPKL